MEIAMIAIFVIGYLFIAFEHSIHINKAASALITGVLIWAVYIMSGVDYHEAGHHLLEHLGEISSILFFLIGAMTIVELIDSHDGFAIITAKITTTSQRKLLLIVCVLTFFFSATLDNLTTTIVMVSLLRKLIADRDTRLFFVGMVVVSANAGGAWSPIGDVTTTMLWIGNQITAPHVVVHLIIPSLVCMIVPLAFVLLRMKGEVKRPKIMMDVESMITTVKERNFIFYAGVAGLLFVPIFKTVTHLPPFMGMLLSLGVLWVITERMHRNKNEEDKHELSVINALKKIDVASVLFFLGILVAIASLQTNGSLRTLAEAMDRTLGNVDIILMAIGLLSAIVDNVPLVAAAMGMYDLATYPTDSYFWTFLAYCAGTGGSALIIGSAAGVAAMGMERIDFFWYLKRIAFLALIGYFAGAFTFMFFEKVVF
ncbi:MAG: sodium:proton antiporter NhaD [Bacteroidia bacterium]|nr:sodium:proton antiporter NhaD [Bacteroidia bacterium]NNC86351.1 sodium:proton antiporter NhaD [Bacteroidia bacterium]NNM15648.1 sodium:proton antiporter NhaD [Bacteroidia bacterium]